MYHRKLKEYEEKPQDRLVQMEEHSKPDESFYLTVPKVLSLASRALEIFESSEVNKESALISELTLNMSVR